ncbi:hypothetical protein [Nonomuraea sp. NPDC003804]|uniref:hypothetical protein n=1 Tax=Nonomuraea sp. NPDC003804 TaxID=3154547 RepID=UPI00339F10C1
MLESGGLFRDGCGRTRKATKSRALIKELPASTLDCMVGVMMKYGDQPTLRDIVDGKLDVSNDFKAFGAKEKQVQREMSDCA